MKFLQRLCCHDWQALCIVGELCRYRPRLIWMKRHICSIPKLKSKPVWGTKSVLYFRTTWWQYYAVHNITTVYHFLDTFLELIRIKILPVVGYTCGVQLQSVWAVTILHSIKHRLNEYTFVSFRLRSLENKHLRCQINNFRTASVLVMKNMSKNM